MKTLKHNFTNKQNIFQSMKRRSFMIFAVLIAVFMVNTAMNAAEPDSPGVIARKAVESGNLKKVKELVKNDPALLYQTIGKEIPNHWQIYEASLLHFASQTKNVDILKFLLEQGADPTVKDSDNFTPIAYAGVQNNKEMVCYLLANGSKDPTDDCMDLSLFNQSLIRIAGDEVSKEKTQLVQQRMQQLEVIAGRIQSAKQNVDLKQYLLEIPEKKTNDFYKRFVIKDDMTYKGKDQWEYVGKNVKGWDGLYSGLHNLTVSDTDLENLAKTITNVTKLDIQSCDNFTDAGLKYIADMKNLRLIWIHGNNNITDAGLKSLKDLTHLENLHLGYCEKISDECLQYMRDLTALTSLNLCGNKNITGSGLQYLINLTKLTAIELHYCSITDDNLKNISSLKQLVDVNLEKCPITDIGLEHLKSLTGLKYLKLEKCPNITESGREQLQEALPNCKIYPVVEKKTSKSSSTTPVTDLTETAKNNTETKNGNSTNPFIIEDKPVVVENKKRDILSKTNVELSLYMKDAADFEYKKANLENFLKFGTLALMQNVEELNKKLRSADAFDKSEIEKQIKSTKDKIKAKQKEIKDKTFYQEYSYSPYDSDIKINGNTAEFPIHIAKDFYPYFPNGELKKFVFPFSDTTGKVLVNKRGDIENIVDSTLGRFKPKWTQILISGSTDSIKKLVREKEKYKLRLWFKNLHIEENEEAVPDMSNPFARVRTVTRLIPFAEVTKIEIVDVNAPVSADSSESKNNTETKTDNSANPFVIEDNTDIAEKTAEQTKETIDVETISTPSLDKPEEWIKALQELPKNEMNPVVNAQRFQSLLEFADAAQNEELYNKLRNEFYNALKSIDSPDQRIDFICDILSGMYRRKNFEGLKEATRKIDVIMEKQNYRNSTWKVHCAYLAAFAVLCGDKVSANGFIEAGRLNPKNKDADTADVFLMTYLIKAITMQPINLQEINNVEKSIGGFNSDNVHILSGIGVFLAERGEKESYTDFQGIVKKLRGYKKSCAYRFGHADAILGEFEEARSHWKQYQDVSRLWSHQLLSFIVRQEFLAGQFDGYEDMQQGRSKIYNLRNKTEQSGDGKNYDFSHYVSLFYFDYGRGLARHKSDQEILQAYSTLKNELETEDFAFFSTGIATGLQDRKNTKQNAKIGVTNKDQNNIDSEDENADSITITQPNSKTNESDSIETEQNAPTQRTNTKRTTRGTGRINTDDIRRGIEIYRGIRGIIGR
jgi:hypothetical protein